MKKLLTAILALFLALPTICAGTVTYEIKQELSVSQIQTELQTIINGADGKDTVFVTGSKTNADITLNLDLDAKKVVWKAHYQSLSSFVAANLIFLSGNGSFEVTGTLITSNANAINLQSIESVVIVSGNGKVQTFGDGANAILTNGNVEIKDNAYLSSTTGETIASNSDKAIVKVSGGSVTATSENAIITKGKDATTYISGGYVGNDAVGDYPAIYAKDQNFNSNALVSVNGTGKVEAKGDGYAIASHGSVEVGGNAQVSNTTGIGNAKMAAISANYRVIISGNAKVSASHNYTIYCSVDVMITDSAIVEAKNDAIAVYVYNNSNLSNVSVSGHAQIIASNNLAIAHNDNPHNWTGVTSAVFAYGKAISDVISSPNITLFNIALEKIGVILAWDKDAGNTNYERFSTQDIFIYPETATAYWDVKAGKSGISYINANNTNTGFIPIDLVNVLSVSDFKFSDVKIYPNPTTGQLTIDNGEWTINSVELYDVVGKKQFSIIHCPLSIEKIDISHLQKGIYFVKIKTDLGEEVRKVVKL